MKLLHCSDVHIDASYSIPNHLDRQFNALHKIRTTAIKYKVEYILVSGDLIDTVNVSEEARNNLLAFFIMSSIKDSFKWVLINGNHDKYDDSYTMLSVFKRLSRITGNLIVVENNPKLLEFDNLSIMAIPYNRKVNTKTFHKYIEDGKKRSKGEYYVVMAHLFCTGAKADSGYNKTGNINIPKEVMWDWMFLGDVHKYQKVHKYAYYSGAPIQKDFGEFLPKGVIVVDLKRKKHKFVSFKPSSKIPQLVTLRDVPKKWPKNTFVRLITNNESNEELPDCVLQNVVEVQKQEIVSMDLDDVKHKLVDYLSDIGLNKSEQKKAIKWVDKRLEARRI